MRKSILILAVLAVALCTLAISAGMIGRIVAKKYPILSDLPGVHVQVIFVTSKELSKYSSILTEQYLRTMVESILRRRHIRVFTKDELSSVPGEPILGVEVHSAIDKQLSMAAINVRLQLIEDISLRRNNNVRTRATTWSYSATILANFEEIDIVGEVVEKQTLSFCDLYDAVSPRPRIDAKDQEKDSEEDAQKNSKEQPPEKIIERN